MIPLSPHALEVGENLVAELREKKQAERLSNIADETEDIKEMFGDHPAILQNPEILDQIIEQAQPEPIVTPKEFPSINTSISKRMEQRIQLLGGEQNFFIIDPKTYRITPRKAEIAHFIHKHLFTVSFNDMIYCYNPVEGIYTPGQGTIDATVNELCRICNQPDMVKTVQAFVNIFLKGMNVFSQYPFDQTPDRIPFLNSTVALVGGEWKPDDIRHFDMVTWRLNCKYDPMAPTLPVQEVIEGWVGKEDAHLLTQIPAQALLQMTHSQPYKMNYLLYGPPDGGKSCYIDLLQVTFGQNRCAEVPLQQIGTRFTNAALEGRLLNVYDDLSSQEFSNLGAFKKLTGRFTHSIEHKGQDQYEGLIKCVHVFSCNKVPTLNITDDDAFYSRWQPISFPNHFDRDPDWFEDMITSEFLSGFLNLVLNQYVNILGNKLTVNQSIEEVKDFWMRESMPEYSFIKDVLEEGIGFTIPVAECYDLYKNWMVEKGYLPSKVKDPAVFGKAMNKSQMIKTGQERAGTGRYDVYKGVRKKIKPDVKP